MTTQPVQPYTVYPVLCAPDHAVGKSAFVLWQCATCFEDMEDAVQFASLQRRTRPGMVYAVLAYDQISGWRGLRCLAPVGSELSLTNVKHAHAYMAQRDYWHMMETMCRMALDFIYKRIQAKPAEEAGFSPPTAQDIADCPPAKPGEETFDLTDK